MARRVVVVLGCVADGFRVVGPFLRGARAERYAAGTGGTVLALGAAVGGFDAGEQSTVDLLDQADEEDVSPEAVVLTGNLTEGFRAFGPYRDFEAAAASKPGSGPESWVMGLVKPPRARRGAGRRG